MRRDPDGVAVLAVAFIAVAIVALLILAFGLAGVVW
jgi:hypothetical protein